MKHIPVTLSEFRGGLDLKTALPSIQPGFTPNSFNFSINENGGIEKIKGYEDIELSGANLPGDMQKIFSYEKSNTSYSRIITTDSDNWYSVENDGTVARIRNSMTPNSTSTFLIHDDLLYGLDDDNDFATWDGATLTTYAPGGGNGPSNGRLLGLWNGRMYVVPSTDQLRIEWSEPFDFTSATAWPADNYVILSTVGAGSKIIGGAVVGDALIVVTDSAIVRIVNPDNGANTLIANIGCASAKSLAVIDNVLFGMSKRGIFSTDGNSFASIISERVEPLFNNMSANLSSASGIAVNNKYFVSIGLDGIGGGYSSENATTLEVYPSLDNAIMANSYPVTDWTVTRIDGNKDTVWMIDTIDKSLLRRAFTTNSLIDSSNDPVDIECWYELAPTDLGVGDTEKRVHSVRVTGRGADVSIGVKTDFNLSTPELSELSLDSGLGGEWDVSLWDSVLWGGVTFSYSDARLYGRGRKFGFFVSESSGGSTVIESSGDSTLGIVSIYTIEPRFSVSRRYR